MENGQHLDPHPQVALHVRVSERGREARAANHAARTGGVAVVFGIEVYADASIPLTVHSVLALDVDALPVAVVLVVVAGQGAPLVDAARGLERATVEEIAQ